MGISVGKAEVWCKGLQKKARAMGEGRTCLVGGFDSLTLISTNTACCTVPSFRALLSQLSPPKRQVRTEELGTDSRQDQGGKSRVSCARQEGVKLACPASLGQ